MIIGAGKIGTALAQYRGFRQRGFNVIAVYDSNPEKIGRSLEGIEIRDMARFEADVAAERPEIAVIAIPGEGAQEVLDLIVRTGIKAVLNFAPIQLNVPPDVTREGGEHGDGAGRAVVRADESGVSADRADGAYRGSERLRASARRITQAFASLRCHLSRSSPANCSGLSVSGRTSGSMPARARTTSACTASSEYRRAHHATHLLAAHPERALHEHAERMLFLGR